VKEGYEGGTSGKKRRIRDKGEPASRLVFLGGGGRGGERKSIRVKVKKKGKPLQKGRHGGIAENVGIVGGKRRGKGGCTHQPSGGGVKSCPPVFPVGEKGGGRVREERTLKHEKGWGTRGHAKKMGKMKAMAQTRTKLNQPKKKDKGTRLSEKIPKTENNNQQEGGEEEKSELLGLKGWELGVP